MKTSSAWASCLPSVRHPDPCASAGASAPGHDNSSVWGGLLGLSDDEQAELKTKGVI